MTTAYSFHDKLKRFYIGRTISVPVLSIKMDLAQKLFLLIGRQLKGEAQRFILHTDLL